jgi:DNA-binding PadR family transcriptional regulator
MQKDFRLTQLQEIILWITHNHKRSTNQIAQATEEITGISASVGTLYPYLKILEREGLIEVHWPDHQPNREGRPKLYYLTSPGGRGLLDQLVVQRQKLAEWQQKDPNVKFSLEGIKFFRNIIVKNLVTL